MMSFGAIGGTGMLLGFLFWFVLVLLVIGSLYLIVSRREEKGSLTPLEILKRRFAGGEISLAEYELAKKTLVLASVEDSGWPKAQKF